MPNGSDLLALRRETASPILSPANAIHPHPHALPTLLPHPPARRHRTPCTRPPSQLLRTHMAPPLLSLKRLHRHPASAHTPPTLLCTHLQSTHLRTLWGKQRTQTPQQPSFQQPPHSNLLLVHSVLLLRRALPQHPQLSHRQQQQRKRHHHRHRDRQQRRRQHRRPSPSPHHNFCRRLITAEHLLHKRFKKMFFRRVML